MVAFARVSTVFSHPGMYQPVHEWKECTAHLQDSKDLQPSNDQVTHDLVDTPAPTDHISINFDDYTSPLRGLQDQPESCSRTVTLNMDDLKLLRTITKTTEIDTGLLIGGVVIISLTVLGLLYHHYLGTQLAHLVQWSRALGWWCPVFIFGLSAILPVIMLPAFPMMALSGPLFTKMYGDNAVVGGSVALITVFGGLWLGSVIAFALGKTVFKQYAIKAGQESVTLQQLNRIIDSGGVKIVLMARALPILPAEIFDYAASLTSLKIWQYAIGCLGSAVPVAFWTFSSAEASVAATKHMSGKGGAGAHIWLIVINIVALVALTLVLYHTIKSQTPPDEEEDEEEDIEEDASVGKSPTHTSAPLYISSHSPVN